jgi:hypothetical protein
VHVVDPQATPSGPAPGEPQESGTAAAGGAAEE